MRLGSDAIVKNVGENDLILQVHDEALGISADILRNEAPMRPDVSLALSFEETWEFAIWIHFDLSGSTYRQIPGVAASG